jgi:hypothetical protein
MLATSSSLLVDILNKFVCKYHQKTVAQLPTSKLCGFEQFGTGGWRTRIQHLITAKLRHFKTDVLIFAKIFSNEKKIRWHVARHVP